MNNLINHREVEIDKKKLLTTLQENLDNWDWTDSFTLISGCYIK